jgi:hypothetical protein
VSSDEAISGGDDAIAGLSKKSKFDEKASTRRNSVRRHANRQTSPRGCAYILYSRGDYYAGDALGESLTE